MPRLTDLEYLTRVNQITQKGHRIRSSLSKYVLCVNICKFISLHMTTHNATHQNIGDSPVDMNPRTSGLQS